MFRDSKTLLQYEAKRSPALADMIANIHLMSKADIKAARIMPWIRQALLDLKRTDDQEHLAVDLEPYIVDSVVPDPVGETRRWISGTTYIKVGRRKALLEITSGQLIWIDGNGGVWIDTVYSEVIDPSLLAYTESSGMMTRLAYLSILRDNRNKHEAAASSSASASADRMFTIYRPT